MNSAVGVSASAYSYIYATVEHPFPSLVAHSPAFSLALSVLPSLNDVITKVVEGGRREEGTSEARCRDTLDSGVIARWRREGRTDCALPPQHFKVDPLSCSEMKLILAGVCVERRFLISGIIGLRFSAAAAASLDFRKVSSAFRLSTNDDTPQISA